MQSGSGRIPGIKSLTTWAKSTFQTGDLRRLHKKGLFWCRNWMDHIRNSNQGGSNRSLRNLPGKNWRQKIMNRSKTGEFLYRYFLKLTTSFQSSLYKAAITCNIEDIHKARVDVKKMNALFILFDTVVPGFSRETGTRRLFKDIFNNAGTIREIQLILLFLE